MMTWLSSQRWLNTLLKGDPGEEFKSAERYHRDQLPVLWLLGKTGAGKTSVIQRLTGDSRARVGNGFEPCTPTSQYYDHPAEAPVMRFLDTRGLGEPDYDPAMDLMAARGSSHALIVLTRVDDTAQKDVCDVLSSRSLKAKDLAVLHVHTALHTLSSEQIHRAVAFNAAQIETALGRKLPTTRIDFSLPEDQLEEPDFGIEELRNSITELVPELSRVLSDTSLAVGEESQFNQHRRTVLGYAGMAAAADAFPAIGLFAVPGLQGKMMYSLAERYGIEWDQRKASEFVAVMGASFLYRYALSLGIRQIGKLVPLYGQTAGAAAAASISFASTYALGRTVALYLYRKKHHQPIDSEILRHAFTQAFDENKDKDKNKNKNKDENKDENKGENKDEGETKKDMN